MIVIVDLGIGNILNVRRAIEHVGGSAIVSSDCADITSADKIVLPGVGHFRKGMAALVRSGMDACLRERAHAGVPLLGICLGMQLLMDESEEDVPTCGLSIISGRVEYFRDRSEFNQKCKVPAVGWFPLIDNGRSWKNTCLASLKNGTECYFVHSLCVVPSDPMDSLAVTHYGDVEYSAVIQKNNVTGCQFHPEKSASSGLKIIQNFICGTGGSE